MVIPMNPRALTPAQWVLAVLVVVGLAIDAFVHFDLADAFAGVKTSTLSQADLFRVESVAAIVATTSPITLSIFSAGCQYGSYMSGIGPILPTST